MQEWDEVERRSRCDSGCSSLGLLRRKVARIMMPFTHTPKSLIGHVILTLPAASAPEPLLMRAPQTLMANNLSAVAISSPMAFLLVPSETHGEMATSIFLPFSRILLASNNRYSQSTIDWAGTPALVVLAVIHA